ncbi:tetraacyldisaccharide 4'-kinase [Polaribacter aestuariivivens]|uniref:Tetraacyldisaccharide 4'-kinase n=1 Tax=Polaribacter aestuariivivens TaxID=2304626 RepID=A0A5S3N144_9FLAO|nr:tetraacyldisaccharide 4'-kinase [Polaribacter aestuariivivens]TMM29038.1 tetraacyldisaccharide 4'-kinase [Polaribacter aestuariivivens]
MKLLRFLLFPFAVVYDLVTRIRNYFFDVGIFKETSFKIPVIVVGNLSVGGTGKTPQIEYLIRLLKNNFKTAVLSRGYKRKTQGFVMLNNTHSVEDVGDEPLQYFQKFNNIDVAVDANRVAGIRTLIKDKKPEVILLDDAFQHRKVKGSFYILLTKYDDLFSDDFLLPTGNLRESSRGAARADVIVVTKCPLDLNGLEKEKIKKKLRKYKKEVFFTTIKYANTLSGSATITVEELKDYEVLLITGIANPKPLRAYLKFLGIRFQHLKFNDHHEFSNHEISDIKERFEKITSPKKIILTTEKDYVRLVNKIEILSFLAIETSFLEEKETRFNNLILNHIKQKG